MKQKQFAYPALMEIVHSPNVSHAELLTVLHPYFQHVTHPLQGRARRFGDQNQTHYLDVHFKKDGTISTLYGNLSDPEAKKLASHLRSVLLENQQDTIGQAICFSLHDAVRGSYRYKDIFQILPIPTDAPHAPVIAADHPFVLEFKYVSCSDAMINTYRRTERAAQLARVLNILCNTAISGRSVFVGFFWAIPTDKSNCRWTQEGYGYASFSPQLSGFSSAQAVPPIKCFPASEYYDEGFFPGDYALALPASIGQYLDRVFSLAKDEAKAFELASVWFAQVKELLPRASSSALVAVVSAVEALLEKESEICSECGQHKFGITKKFKNFLESYVPGIEKRFPEEFRAIYEMRSSLAHGERVLMADLRPWNYFGDPVQQWQNRFQTNTYRITATALRNWVLSRQYV